jgi:hypothetical protein
VQRCNLRVRILPLHRAEGTSKTVLNGVRMAIRAGSMIVVPAGVQHNVINTGSVPLKLSTIGAAITDNDRAATGSFHSGAGRGSGDNHEQGGGISGLLEMGKNLAIVAIIIALVVGGTALSRWILPEARGKGVKASATQNL